MILVFYIILVTLIFFAILAIMIYFSKLEFKIENLKISNIRKESNNKILVQISLKIKNYHWISIKLNKKRLIKIYKTIRQLKYKNNINKEIFKNINKEEIKSIREKNKIKKIISDTKIEKLDAEIAIGTEDYIITSYIIAIISIIISNILPHIIEKNVKKIEESIKYNISPIYKPKNVCLIEINIIINTKISHFIQIIHLLQKISKSPKKKNQNINKYKNMTDTQKRNIQTV